MSKEKELKDMTKVEIKEGLEGAKEFLAKNPVFEVPFEFCFTGDESAGLIETITAVSIMQSIQNLTPKGRGDFLKKIVVQNAAREAADAKDMDPDLKALFLKKLQEGK